MPARPIASPSVQRAHSSSKPARQRYIALDGMELTRTTSDVPQNFRYFEDR